MNSISILTLLVISTVTLVECVDIRLLLPSGFENLVPKLKSRTTSFSCSGKGHGYYADTDFDCQIFHMCFPIEDAHHNIVYTAHYAHICPQNTIFSQDTLTCSFIHEALPCERATELYERSNALVGVATRGDHK